MFTQMAWRVAAARRRKLRPLALAHQSRVPRRLFGAKSGLVSVMLLSGCTWFAPDAGMGVVTTIAQQELNKDAAAIRSPEKAAHPCVRGLGFLGRADRSRVLVELLLRDRRDDAHARIRRKPGAAGKQDHRGEACQNGDRAELEPECPRDRRSAGGIGRPNM